MGNPRQVFFKDFKAETDLVMATHLVVVVVVVYFGAIYLFKKA